MNMLHASDLFSHTCSYVKHGKMYTHHPSRPAPHHLTSEACNELEQIYVCYAASLLCVPAIAAITPHRSPLDCKHSWRDVQVGGEMPGGLSVRGLSGGEKRRLRIACALVAQPSCIYLDEPTSGMPLEAGHAPKHGLPGEPLSRDGPGLPRPTPCTLCWCALRLQSPIHSLRALLVDIQPLSAAKCAKLAAVGLQPACSERPTPVSRV